MTYRHFDILGVVLAVRLLGGAGEVTVLIGVLACLGNVLLGHMDHLRIVRRVLLRVQRRGHQRRIRLDNVVDLLVRLHARHIAMVRVVRLGHRDAFQGPGTWLGGPDLELAGRLRRRPSLELFVVLRQIVQRRRVGDVLVFVAL